MRDHRRRTARAALPLLLGAAAAIFFASAAAASLRQKSYTDAQNNYSFSYPAAYRLRAETDFFELSQARKPVLYGRISERMRAASRSSTGTRRRSSSNTPASRRGITARPTGLTNHSTARASTRRPSSTWAGD